MVNKKKNKTVKTNVVKSEDEKIKESQSLETDKEEVLEEVKEKDSQDIKEKGPKEVKNFLIEDLEDEGNTKTELVADKELSSKKQDSVKKNWFKDTFSRIKNYRPTIEDIGLICGFITLIICSVFIIINIIRKENIIIWIILLCSGLIPLSICLDDRKERLLEEKQRQEESKSNSQEKKQDKTSHSNAKTKKKSK